MSADVQGLGDNSLQQYKIEEETTKQILLLEKEFREYNSSVEKEVQSQSELVSRVWVLSQRYILLESTGPCCQYPEIYTAPAEDTLLQEFTEKIKLIKDSNSRIWNSLKELRKSNLVFEKLCAQLDMHSHSPFIIGDTFHKPIAFFIELFCDLFKYFHAWILKLRYSSHQFDPYKIESIDSYKKLLEPSEDFKEYLNVGLTYCKCLRSKSINRKFGNNIL